MDGYRNGYNGADLKSDVAKALWVRILHHPPVTHYYFRIGIYDHMRMVRLAKVVKARSLRRE